MFLETLRKIQTYDLKLETLKLTRANKCRVKMNCGRLLELQLQLLEPPKFLDLETLDQLGEM